MGTFLAVLRVCGIVLLCILAFVLLLLLLLIFVPYRYRLEAEKDEKLFGRAFVHWLLYFLTAELVYDEGINLRIRVLGIPVYDKKKKEAKEAKAPLEERKPKKKGKKGKTEAEEPKADEQSAVSEDKEGGEAFEATTAKEAAAEKEAGNEKEAAAAKEAKEEPAEQSDKPDKKAGDIYDKLLRFLESLEDSIEELTDAPQEAVDKLFDKAEELSDKYWFYRSLLDSEGTEWVIKYVKKRLLGILKGIKPTSITAQLALSDEDPARVAQAWQYYALALPLIDRLRGSIELDARQDEASLSGRARIKGRIRLNSLIWHGGLLLINKKVKKFLTLLREGKA